MRFWLNLSKKCAQLRTRERGWKRRCDLSEQPTREDGTKESRRIQSQKKKHKGLHKDRKWDFKGSIICEFASSWTIGRKFAKYEQGGKGRKTKKNEDKEGKQRRTRKRKEITVFQIAY